MTKQEIITKLMSKNTMNLRKETLRRTTRQVRKVKLTKLQKKIRKLQRSLNWKTEFTKPLEESLSLCTRIIKKTLPTKNKLD